MTQSSSGRPSRWFLFSTLALALAGFLLFSSASLGLLSRDGPSFNLVAGKQAIILLISLAVFMIVSKIDYRRWRPLALWLFLGSLLFALLVFVPGIGFSTKGASRWVLLGPLTIQPSEFLKLAFVIYLAAWFAQAKEKVRAWSGGLFPLLVLGGLVSAIIVAEPDIDTLIITLASGLAMFFVAGARWRDLGLLLLLVALTIGIVSWWKPYIRARLSTFIHPQAEQLGASYQINQSLIALGSGGLTGRGFGQSIQKFKYLPEPIGDSIFSVAGEEFGLLGALSIVLLFVSLGIAGFKIAATAPSLFGRLLAVGIVIMITVGAFINIASMVGLIPLMGTPLLFVSQGGTALLVALLAAGIVLNISRQAVKKH